MTDTTIRTIWLARTVVTEPGVDCFVQWIHKIAKANKV